MDKSRSKICNKDRKFSNNQNISSTSSKSSNSIFSIENIIKKKQENN